MSISPVTAGREHKYGPPALCCDSVNPVSSMSTVAFLKTEFEDRDEKLSAWSVARLETELAVEDLLAVMVVLFQWGE